MVSFSHNEEDTDHVEDVSVSHVNVIVWDINAQPNHMVMLPVENMLMEMSLTNIFSRRVNWKYIIRSKLAKQG